MTAAAPHIAGAADRTGFRGGVRAWRFASGMGLGPRAPDPAPTSASHRKPLPCPARATSTSVFLANPCPATSTSAFLAKPQRGSMLRRCAAVGNDQPLIERQAARPYSCRQNANACRNCMYALMLASLVEAWRLASCGRRSWLKVVRGDAALGREQRVARVASRCMSLGTW